MTFGRMSMARGENKRGVVNPRDYVDLISCNLCSRLLTSLAQFLGDDVHEPHDFIQTEYYVSLIRKITVFLLRIAAPRVVEVFWDFGRCSETGGQKVAIWKRRKILCRL